jgi:osmotically-inducible protein OsmY
MTQKQEDAALLRNVKAAMARNPLDISELIVSVNRGTVEMMGKVKAPRGSSGGFQTRKEFQTLQTQVRAVRGVKDVFAPKVGIVE